MSGPVSTKSTEPRARIKMGQRFWCDGDCFTFFAPIDHRLPSRLLSLPAAAGERFRSNVVEEGRSRRVKMTRLYAPWNILCHASSLGTHRRLQKLQNLASNVDSVPLPTACFGHNFMIFQFVDRFRCSWRTAFKHGHHTSRCDIGIHK